MRRRIAIRARCHETGGTCTIIGQLCFYASRSWRPKRASEARRGLSGEKTDAVSGKMELVYTINYIRLSVAVRNYV